MVSLEIYSFLPLPVFIDDGGYGDFGFTTEPTLCQYDSFDTTFQQEAVANVLRVEGAGVIFESAGTEYTTYGKCLANSIADCINISQAESSRLYVRIYGKKVGVAALHASFQVASASSAVGTQPQTRLEEDGHGGGEGGGEEGSRWDADTEVVETVRKREISDAESFIVARRCMHSRIEEERKKWDLKSSYRISSLRESITFLKKCCKKSELFSLLARSHMGQGQREAWADEATVHDFNYVSLLLGKAAKKVRVSLGHKWRNTTAPEPYESTEARIQGRMCKWFCEEGGKRVPPIEASRTRNEITIKLYTDGVSREVYGVYMF